MFICWVMSHLSEAASSERKNGLFFPAELMVKTVTETLCCTIRTISPNDCNRSGGIGRKAQFYFLKKRQLNECVRVGRMTNRPAAGRVGSASWLGPVGGLIDGVDVLNRPPTRRVQEP